MQLSDQVREAIRTCGVSRYRIWKETGVAQETLSRFMTGKGGLSIEALDKVAAFVGLQVVREKPNRPYKGGG